MDDIGASVLPFPLSRRVDLRSYPSLRAAEARPYRHPDALPVVGFVTMASNGIIGSAAGIPWDVPGARLLFRKIVRGRPVVMGRRAHDDIGHWFRTQDVVVLSRSEDWSRYGVSYARSVFEAVAAASVLAACSEKGEIAVLGGAETFAAFMPYMDRFEACEIDASPRGDVSLPALGGGWSVVSREEGARSPRDGYGFSHVTMRRSATQG